MGGNIVYSRTLLGASSGFSPASGFSASGTFTDGQTVTITKSGGGFGTKPNGAKPLAYFPYSTDLAYDAAASRSITTIVSGTQHAFDSTVHPVNSTGSAKVTQNDTDGNAGLVYGWSTPATELYCFHHRYVTPDIRNWITGGNSANMKQVRARASINSGVPNTYIITSPVSDGAWGMNSDTVGGGIYHVTGIGPSYMSDYSTSVFDALTGWHTVETWFRGSTGDAVADAQIVHWTNGARVFYYPETIIPPGTGADRNTTGFITRNGDTGYVGWDNLAMVQCSNQTSGSPIPASSFVYYGPTLIDDSPCRVIVSTESTWNTSSSTTVTRDFQLPTSWADGAISFTIRKGIHSSLSGLYAYAVLSDGYTVLKLGQFT